MSVRRHSPLLVVCCCLTVYFAFHAVEGKHGLKARHGLAGHSSLLAGELKTLDMERRRLEREVALLQDGSADPDFVEELARGLLGYARPSDRVLLETPPRMASIR